MDYPCAKFGDFGLSLSRFGFIVRTDRQTDRIQTGADDRYTDAATVNVSRLNARFPLPELTARVNGPS